MRELQTQQVIGSSNVAGPARFTQNISLLYAPNNAAAGAVMQRFAQVSMLTHSQPLNTLSVSCTCRHINADDCRGTCLNRTLMNILNNAKVHVCNWQAAACPPDPTKKAAMSTSFYRYFAAPDAPPECQDPAACMANAACWQRLLGAQIRGVKTEAEAVQQALRCQ